MLHVHVCIYVLIKHAVYVLLQCAEIPNLQHCAEQHLCMHACMHVCMYVFNKYVYV